MNLKEVYLFQLSIKDTDQRKMKAIIFRIN